LGVKHQLRKSRFLVFQDNPGAGFQASIFKRFYWWENECTERICAKFGIEIVRKSFRELGEAAKSIGDPEAQAAADARQVPLQGVTSRSYLSALKLYLAVKHELDADPSIQAAGINCLNESHFSDTTPCLAWNILYEEEKLIWGCEGDTMSMLTKLILHRSLGVPIMMSNLYPFLMGQAALKHERIPSFPAVPEPENCILLAHCGYLGVLPQSFSTEWELKPKVLAIVNDNATAIDARLPCGQVTLAKLHPKLDTMSVAEGALESYAQYSASDCLNGAVIRVKDGPAFVRSLASHHYLITTGHNEADIRMLGTIFDFSVESL
jgi:L-fucose isomerase-like protein